MRNALYFFLHIKKDYSLVLTLPLNFAIIFAINTIGK